MQEDKLLNFLNEYREVLKVLGSKYSEKIYETLISDSKWDNLFFEKAKEYGLNVDNLKSDVIKRITSDYHSFTNEFIKLNSKEKFTQLKKDKALDIIEKFYEINDIYTPNCDIDDMYEILYEEIMNHMLTGKNSNYKIEELFEMLDIEKQEVEKFLPLVFCANFYETVNYYLNIDLDNEILDNELFFPIDVMNHSVFTMLDTAKNVEEVMEIYSINYETIMKAFYFQFNLDQMQKDKIKQAIIDEGKIKNLVNICPFIIFNYRKFYNCKFEAEEIESVRITQEIIEIIESLNIGANPKNDTYLSTLTIINSMSTHENTDNWFKYVISNVYENIVNLSVTTNEDRTFIRYIENHGVNDIIHEKGVMLWILSKFYIYNSFDTDIQTLSALREKTPKIKKKYIQKINPYYNEETKNFGKLKQKED